MVVEYELLRKQKDIIDGLKTYFGVESTEFNAFPYFETEKLGDDFLYQMLSEHYELELKYQEILMQRKNSEAEKNNLKKIEESRMKIMNYLENIQLAFEERELICREKLKHHGIDVNHASVNSNFRRELDVLNKLYLFLLEKKVFLTIYRVGVILPIKILEKSRKHAA